MNIPQLLDLVPPRQWTEGELASQAERYCVWHGPLDETRLERRREIQEYLRKTGWRRKGLR